MQNNETFDDIEAMRNEIDQKKQKSNYDTSEPWEPMREPRRFGGLFSSLVVALLVMIATVAIASFIGTMNAGVEFSIFGIFTL